MRSKDPNTKVGAAVFDPETNNIILGYNGFPPGFPDHKLIWDQRTGEINKYHLVVHAEANAIRKAMLSRVNFVRATLFSTHRPCHRCFVDWIIPSGIKQIVYAIHRDDPLTDVLLRHYLDIQVRQVRVPDRFTIATE